MARNDPYPEEPDGPGKYKKGDRVVLKEFIREYEGINEPRSVAEILDEYDEGFYTVRIDAEYLTDPRDDGLREGVTDDMILGMEGECP